MSYDFFCGTPCKNGSKLDSNGDQICRRPVRNPGGKCNWHKGNEFTAPETTAREKSGSVLRQEEL